MSKRKNYIILLIIVYATMLLFGLIENIKGVAFPLIKDTFKETYDSQGGLVSFSWFGYVFFCIVATFSIQKFGIKKSLIFGYLSLLIGCIAVLFAPSFLFIAISLFILWMGFGFFEIGNNALATTIFSKKSAVFMSLMHFFYGLGAVIGPRYATVISENLEYSYKGIYAVTLIPIILFLLVTMFSRFKVSHEEEEEKPTMTVKAALKNKYVWLIALALGFMEVIEFGAGNWGSFYIQDVLGFDIKTGSTFISVFYIFFTFSRLFGGIVIEIIGYLKSLIIALISTFLLYLIGFSLGREGIWVIASSGLFIAILWPTIMSYAIKIFGKNTAIASSVIIVISGMINGIMQLGTGFINEYIGPMWGYRLNTLYVLISLMILIVIAKLIKKQNLNLNLKG